MPRKFWLYCLECIPTGQLYIGQSSRRNPCIRWSEHVSALIRGDSCHPLLQAAWQANPGWRNWQFRVLDIVAGKRATNYREAELILAMPVDKRLNSPNTSTLSLAKHQRVAAMLAAGIKYHTIRDTVGISTGMISRIATQLRAEQEKENLYV